MAIAGRNKKEKLTLLKSVRGASGAVLSHCTDTVDRSAGVNFTVLKQLGNSLIFFFAFLLASFKILEKLRGFLLLLLDRIYFAFSFAVWLFGKCSELHVAHCSS